MPTSLRNVAFNHSFTRFDEESFACIQIAKRAGIRHGAVDENLRHSVLGDMSECRTSWGVELTKDGNTCQFHGGTGTISTGAQTDCIGGSFKHARIAHTER